VRRAMTLVFLMFGVLLFFAIAYSAEISEWLRDYWASIGVPPQPPSPHLPRPPDEPVPTAGPGDQMDARLLMQISITLILMATCLFMIVSKKYAPKDKHWAFATIGTMLGFWLKP
jgi:hypothetical protein